MISDCPDPKEISDFHFLQLRTLKITKENESLPEKCINLVSSASKYDLLFVGAAFGFKVLKLENILVLDDDKENRATLEDYPFFLVACDTPVLLNVNANQTVLAVCTKSSTGTVLLLYSLSNFPGFDSPWQPFCSKQISTPGSELQNFSWNPALEGLFAFCLSDGSLHIYEISGTSLKANASLSDANACTVCWSPKGKQLVVGKMDGSFCQYKPNLTPVSTIMPPTLEDGPISVTSICWISNTVFAVVYVTNDAPNLFIVSTPKGGAASYTNFNDVCFGNNSASEQKYLMHFEPLWGLLICASFDSIEIAVLGDMPNWVQWDLKEDGKALLPGKDGALNAVGMTVMYSSQKQILISESLSYAPMPVMFFLTNNGLLVSFHMINESHNAPTLVASPVPVDLKFCSGNDLSFKNCSGTEELVEKNSFISSNQPFMSSSSANGESVSSSHLPSSVNISQNEMLRMKTKSAFTLSSRLENTHNINKSENETVITNFKKPEILHTSSITENQKNIQIQPNSTVFMSEKENDVPENTKNSYINAIIAEIQSFDKELQELKQLQNSVPANILDDDMVSLKAFALNLEKFQKDMTETMKSLSCDIYNLKNVLLESFVLFEEASSRERRRNDHSYITMLKERALDPITAKRMQKINQIFQYLSTQLQEVNNKLDQDWILYMSNKKKMSNFNLSSTEAIYKTIVNNQKIIYNWKKKVDWLLKKAEERKLRNITNSSSWNRHYKRSPREDLSKLADEFLQVKIKQEDDGEHSLTKKLSSESQNFLIEFLKKSSVVTVRPTAVYSPSQSRLLFSNTTLSDDASKLEQTQDKVTSHPLEKEQNKNASPVYEIQNTPSMAGHFKESSVKTYPIYEPITPPELDSIEAESEPANKTFTYLSKENYPEMLSHLSSVSATENLEKGFCSSLLSSGKNNNEFQKFSFSSQMQVPVFNQTLSQVTSSSAVNSSTFSFTTSIQKDSESNTSRPFTYSNSSISLPVSSFQFGQKRDSFWSASSIMSSSTSSTLKPCSNDNVLTENSLLTQQNELQEQHSDKIFIVSSSSNANCILPTSETSLVSKPVARTAEEKFSSSVQDNENPSAILPIENSPVFSFEINKSDQTKKTDDATNSAVQSLGNFNSTLNPTNNTFFTVTESSNIQEQDIKIDSQKSTNNLASFNISSKQAFMNTALENDDVVDLSNQSKKSSSDSNELNQQVSLSIVSSNPAKITPATSAIESVTNSEVITSQSNLSFSKLSPPPPPPLNTLHPQNTLSSATTLFEQTTSTASLTSPKSDETTASSFQVTEQLQSVTSPIFSSSKTEVCTSSEASAVQTSLGQQFVSTTISQITSFDQSVPAVTQTTTFLSQPSPTTVTQTNLFGQPSVTTTTQTTLFGQSTPTSVTQTTFFGQPSSTSKFSSTSGGFFSQTPSFGTDAAPTVTTSVSNFSTQSSTFSFGKPAFGQTTGSFGLAKSLFSQDTTSFTQTATPSSFSFSQNSSVFGQGSFFSGLGGKPSEENASKNVFGITSGIKSSDTNNLFKNSSIKSFGATNGSSFLGSGNFSSGAGSVAQSGFGSFQQTPNQQPGGFGSAPTFGGNPAFGSPPSFGGSPGFGSGNSLSPVFGQQQVSSSFSNFANASSPTFGSLASQSPTFGSSSGFGSAPAFGASSFGGQSPGFGSLGSPPTNSSAFTQWRN